VHDKPHDKPTDIWRRVQMISASITALVKLYHIHHISYILDFKQQNRLKVNHMLSVIINSAYFITAANEVKATTCKAVYKVL